VPRSTMHIRGIGIKTADGKQQHCKGFRDRASPIQDLMVFHDADRFSRANPANVMAALHQSSKHHPADFPEQLQV